MWTLGWLTWSAFWTGVFVGVVLGSREPQDATEDAVSAAERIEHEYWLERSR